VDLDARPDRPRPHSRCRRADREVALTGAAGTALVVSVHVVPHSSRDRPAAARPSIRAVWRRPGSEPTP